MSEQLNLFSQLYGDVTKYWDEAEKNDCGVYVKYKRIYGNGSRQDGFRLELETCKHDGKLLYETSVELGDYGSHSPLRDYSESISVYHSAEDICRQVKEFLMKRIKGDSNLDTTSKKYERLIHSVDIVIDMLRGDLYG